MIVTSVNKIENTYRKEVNKSNINNNNNKSIDLISEKKVDIIREQLKQGSYKINLNVLSDKIYESLVHD